MQPIEQQAMRPEVISKIDQLGVIAVLVIDEEKHAIPVAEALIQGGVQAIELTLRTPAALAAAAAIKKHIPTMMLGFGTVLTTSQVEAVADAGADFAVAPGCNPKVIEAAINKGVSFAPGVMTPSDIEIAVELGCRVLKYFPAETAGGMAQLKSISAPYQYLDLRFIPLGGINYQNANAYLDSPLVTAIGGSWIAQRALIQQEKWSEIENNARDIVQKIKEIKKH